jgi:CRISPR-associated endonuclease/helicase Cas3
MTSKSAAFAHSLANRPSQYWQSLSAHAQGVAELAARHGDKFCAGEIARVAGLLHDIGKYSEKFQRKLEGDAIPADHSTAGARIAAEKYPFPGPGRLIAYLIAGHHAGLANGAGTGDLTPLDIRLDPKKYDVPKVSGWEEEISLPTALGWPELARYPDPAIAGERKGLSLSLLGRMVFSALVDADRLDTEAFYAKAEGKGEPPRGSWQPLARLKERLDQHMLQMTAKAEQTIENDGQRAVNAERAHILAAARAKALESPGIFSLTVPTGGGKTLASLTFALDHAVKNGLDRVIYVIPFTSIIEQTARVFREALGGDLADHVLEHHSAFREEEALAALEKRQGATADESSLQAGERLRLATENWDAAIVVTTAVQFFESLFSNRPTRCRKLHNIAKSVVILDEAQTLPLKLLRPCIAALDELARNYKTSIVLCTATQPALTAKRQDGSDGFVGGFVDVREIVPDPRGLYQRMKRVTVKSAITLDDAGLIEALRRHEKVLCIVGTRAHARDLTQQLRGSGASCAFHLSALMCPAHRSKKLDEIRGALGVGPCRVIATTVVEAGVDIDFPVVYRVMAGLDSIAQAAGRCNREGKLEREGAIVQLFEIEGRKSVQELRANEAAAREVLRTPDLDPLSLEAIEAYFRRLYWVRTAGRADGLDAHDILPALNVQASDVTLPFADVARAFRIIESAMEPVIIPYDDKARRLIGELAKAERPGPLARKLQPYIVNVPPKAFFELRRIGGIQPVSEPRFGEQFCVLKVRDLYSDDLGLDWNDPTFRSAESNIV